MRIEPEISGVSIVLIGAFNPSNFDPEWFVEKKLLPVEDSHSIEVEVVSSLLTRFSMDWFQLHVDVNRFQVSTLQYPCVRIRDLVMRVFHEHYPQMTFQALGINRDVHFPVASEAKRHEICRLLAPIEPWEGISNLLDLKSEGGGMASLMMSQAVQSDEVSNRIVSVNVKSSQLIKNGRSGFHVQVNEHTEFSKGEIGELQMIECLENRFDVAIRNGDDIVEHVMSLSFDKQPRHLDV